MRLAVNLGYQTAGRDDAWLAVATEAERLGYAVAWVAEAYGADAASVLGYLSARTERIGIGSAAFQIPGRTPAMTAMTAASLDQLSGGRFHLGLGVSGPVVSEGWHGAAFAAPLARTREYVAIVRSALRRERLAADGPHYPLPLPGGAVGSLRLTVAPVQQPVPIYLAAVGPRNIELAGEIADGWLALFCPASAVADGLAAIARGRRRGPAAAIAGSPADRFDVVVTAALSVGSNVAACADRVRGYAALYLGGMGNAQANFYRNQAERLGFGAAAAEVADHYLAGRTQEAAAAVPAEFIDATSLLGPPERIAERMAEFAAAGVTTLAVAPQGGGPQRVAALRTAVAAAEKIGVSAG